GPPYTIYAGSNNPLVVEGLTTSGQLVSSSTSLVTVPLYSGQQLNSGGGNVTIIGFIQVFLRWVDTPGRNQGNLHATIMNIVACGSGGGGGGGGSGSGTITGGGGQLVPVRLVQRG